MKQAIKPNYFENFKEIGEAPPVTEEKIDDDTLALHSLANTRGWTVLRDFVIALGKELDDMTIKQMENGASFEELGRSTVVKEITKDVLRKIINKVGDAYDSVEQRGKGARGA